MTAPPPARSTVDALPPLARSHLDRAAHRRTDHAWLAKAWQRARVLLVDLGPGQAGPGGGSPAARGGRALVRDADGRVELVFTDPESVPPTEPSERLFLGVDTDGTPVFAVPAPLPDLPGTRAASLRDVGELLSDRDAGILTTAVALGLWHARYPYSPANGLPTTATDGGWMRVDEAGGQYWPRTDPAVIVLVHDGEPGPDGRCLLGRNAAWAGASAVRRFSCLAGFVEAGESAEQTVVREVAEEVGVQVSRVRYVASQAWPFPCSLMLGFTAYADPRQPVRTDPQEISEARWFTRREIAAVLAGEEVPAGDGKRVGLPMAASIAHFLIRRWLQGD
ncbi:MAG: NAD(+) diphosphatase [Micromonosporaceae bacterium]|nr:NAD(+) diphosphatase [Micromonosporaceae bacterium]